MILSQLADRHLPDGRWLMVERLLYGARLTVSESPTCGLLDDGW